MMSVSVCARVYVCPHDHISGTARPIFTEIFVHVTYARGAVLF